MIKQITSFTYRGSLKSCNYACSYCPFAKRAATKEDIQADREALQRFADRLSSLSFREPAEVLVAPYGEVMVHEYYWDFLSVLSRNAFVRRTGCQTNLSFSPDAFLRRMAETGADLGKIALWATFHPEMTSVDLFAARIRQLSCHIGISAGVVGDPGSIPQIRRLREALPPEVYLWINQMDGLGRRYTQEETRFFLSVDPMFSWELQRHGTPPCEGGTRHGFVDAAGRIYPCNRIRQNIGSFYGESWRDSEQPCEMKGQNCSGSRCDCYLAYSHLDSFQNHSFFGEGGLFRVPSRRKVSAVFFDVDGTLTDQNGRIGEQTVGSVAYLASRAPLFLVTELPYEQAQKRCRAIMSFLSGGCYSGGAHIRLADGTDEIVEELPDCLNDLCPKGGHVYEREGRPYRMVLPGSQWKELQGAIAADGIKVMRQAGGMVSLVSREAGKAQGMELLSSRCGISMSLAMVAGNSIQDLPMFQKAGFRIAVPGSDEALAEAADEVLEVRALAWLI